MPNSSAYDFRRCKYCDERAAKPLYALGPGVAVQVCRRCDFHFLNRLDGRSDEDNSRGLAQDAQRYIDNRLDEGLPLLPQRLALIKRQLALQGALCLDIGTGVGQFLLALQQEGAQGEGIEPSPLRREYARKKFTLELRSELVTEPFWQRHYAASFDLITLWDVIEHVNFPVETLRQAIRLLKPGGWLFLETPSRLAFSYRLSQLTARLSGGRLSLFLPSFYSAAPYGHKQIFTPAQLRQLFVRLGFQQINYRSAYAAPLLRRDKIILFARKPLA